MSRQTDLVRRLGQLTLAVFVVSVAAGQLLGQPVLLGFVTTGSMAPTLDPGDGFVAVPAAVAGEPEPGDVVVFRAEELNGGGLTTHRVVRETERGYVTRGDANPFTDQAGGEPPVKDAQIVAHAASVGGTIVVVPELGAAVTALRAGVGEIQRRLAAAAGVRSLLGTQGVALILLGISLAGYLADLVLGDDRQRATRDRSRSDGTSARLIVLGLTGVVVLAATAAMVLPAGSQAFGVVSAEFDSDDPTVIRQGTSETLPFRVPNAGLVPVHAYVVPASDGVEAEPTHVFVPGRASANVTLQLSAPPETGYYRRYVVEHRYLALLPEPLVRELFGVHPWLPIVVIDGLLGGSLYVTGITLIGSGRTRLRNRETRGSRLVRLLRNGYR